MYWVFEQDLVAQINSSGGGRGLAAIMMESLQGVRVCECMYVAAI